MAINPFAGFTYDKPSDIRSFEEQQLQQAMLTGDRNAMRAATMMQATNTLAGGSQAYKKAKKTERILQEAQENTVGSGSTDLETQANYFREAQRLAIDAGLPDIAMQATGQLSAIQATMEERARLMSAEDRAEAAERRAEGAYEKQDKLFEFGMKTKGRFVLVDPEGEYLDTVDILTDEGLARQKALKEAGKDFQMIPETTWFAEISDRRADAAKLKEKLDKVDLPETTKNRFNQLAIGQTTFRTAIDQLVDIIDEAPSGLSTTGKVKGVLEKVGTEGRQFVASNGQTEEEQQAVIANASRKFSVPVERINGAVINLAYALASAREGGKLSESDIELALQTLGVNGNPDPATALTVLRDVVDRNAKTWSQIPDTIIDFKTSQSAMDVWSTQNDAYSALMTKFDTTIEKWSDPTRSASFKKTADAIDTAGAALNALYGNKDEE